VVTAEVPPERADLMGTTAHAISITVLSVIGIRVILYVLADVYGQRGEGNH
jgi:hypothetical protein